MKLLWILLLTFCSTTWAAIGNVVEQTGPDAALTRQGTALPAKKGSGIEQNDTIATTKTRLGLEFTDGTRTQITEQSKVVIDEFFYDPKTPKAGKLAMKVALGTVRYASGAVAKDNRENVRINTPTATIAVRGTDFTMTVDEVGQSLVILLPSCPRQLKSREECWVGEIEVSTDAGAVILNQMFQATVVNSRSSMPSQPKIIDINESLIDNMLIISPPRGLASVSDSRDDQEEKSELDIDLLEYTELEQNYLEEEQLKYTELDINRLDTGFLDDLLSIMTADTGPSLDETPDAVLPNVKNYPWVKGIYNEENIFLFSERSPHIAEIKTSASTNGMANIIQDGVSANIQLNAGGSDVVFNITQTQ